MIQSAAKKLVWPTVMIGAFATVLPELKSVIIVVIAPGTATSIPIVDAVPTAFLVSTLNRDRVGTVRVPPPMPNITEILEIKKAIIAWPSMLGKLLKIPLALAKNIMFVAAHNIMKPKRIVSHRPPNNPANTRPKITPAMRKMNHLFNKLVSKFPFL